MNAEQQENLDSIKAYLNSTIQAWNGMPIADYNKLILDEGKVFTDVVKSDSVQAAKEWRKARRPKIKQCFYNSQLFLITEEIGEYYEGYCYDGLMPFHHGWNVIDGNVVDFTLEARDRSLKQQKIKNNAANAVYLGVLVPKLVIMTNIVATGRTGPIAHKHYLKSNLEFV